MFVVRDRIRQVEVYDAVAFIVRLRITAPLSLSACPVNICFYMLSLSDYFGDNVYRVELEDRNDTVLEWSMIRRPAGLSVNNAHNLLVVSQGEHKLQEFATRGTLLREIQLPPGTGYPWQAVQLPSGQFLVTSRKQMSLIAPNRTVVRAYKADSAVENRMNELRDMAVDEHGNVLVADMANRGLMVLDRSLCWCGVRVR